MIAALIGNTLREAMNRLGGISLLGISAAFALNFVYLGRFVYQEGKTIAYPPFGANPWPAVDYVNNALRLLLDLAHTGWLILTIFVMAGLIVTPFERGYLELLLGKPLSRARLLAGRLLGVMTLTVCGMAVMFVPVLARYRWHVEFPVGNWVRALLVLLCSCLVYAVVMQLIAVFAPLTTVLMLSALCTWLISQSLHEREKIQVLIPFAAVNRVIDWLYYIFPKFSGMTDIINALVPGRPVVSWMPLWSSALFAVGCWALAAFVFSRKSY